MAVLEFENVTKKYGDVTAVKNMSFVTRDGEFMVILGPSGAGKTTTLKIICGLINPTEGRLLMDGKDITKVPPYKRNISMTFENYSLYPHLTVFENIAYPLHAKKGEFTKDQIKDKVVSIASMLHIESLLDRFPAEASGGQKQRIALGRTMVRQPKMYLLDEPLAHLDAKIRVELREEFHRIDALREATTIYVTHDYTEALSLGDRIMLLHDGKVLQLDTPYNIFYQPVHFEVARQVGQPAINAIECFIRNEKDNVILESQKEPNFKASILPAQKDLLQKYKKEKILLGVRPQDVSILEDENKIEVEALVDVFQPLGSEGVLTTSMGNLSIVGLVDPGARLDHNQKIKLYLDAGAFYFFDSDTRDNLAITLQ